MEELVLVIGVLGVGYVLGVWTACAVFRPAQRDYEEATGRSPAPVPVPVAIPGGSSRPPGRPR